MYSRGFYRRQKLFSVIGNRIGKLLTLVALVIIVLLIVRGCSEWAHTMNDVISP